MLIPRIADNILIHAQVLESAISKLYVNVPVSPNRKVYRLDYSSGSLAITDDTTAATSTAANAWNPFGANVIPNTATLKAYDSTDGTWASNELTLTSGSVTDLKSTGWKRFVFGENTNRKDWRPSNSPSFNIAAAKYIMFMLDDGADRDAFVVACADACDIVELRFMVDTAGSPTQAVRISQLHVVRRAADHRWRDRTADAIGDTATAYTPVADTLLPAVGSKFVIGFDTVAYALEAYVFRGLIAGAALTYTERYTGPSTMLTLTGFTSPSNHLQTGVPSTTTTPPTEVTDSWTPPNDWTKRSYGSLTLEGGGTEATPALYYLEYEVTSVPNIAPYTAVIARLRARRFGAGAVSGARAFTAKTFQGLNLFMRGAKTGSGNRTLTFSNLTTGASRAVTIPAATVQGANLPLAFSSAITIPPDQDYGLLPPTGGGAEYLDIECDYAQ